MKKQEIVLLVRKEIKNAMKKGNKTRKARTGKAKIGKGVCMSRTRVQHITIYPEGRRRPPPEHRKFVTDGVYGELIDTRDNTVVVARKLTTEEIIDLRNGREPWKQNFLGSFYH